MPPTILNSITNGESFNVKEPKIPVQVERRDQIPQIMNLSVKRFRKMLKNKEGRNSFDIFQFDKVGSVKGTREKCERQETRCSSRKLQSRFSRLASARASTGKGS